MATAWTPIAWQSLGSASATVTFSSIPGTYRDLRLVITGTNTSGYNLNYQSLNADTTSTNYSWLYVQGSGVSASATQANNDRQSPGLGSVMDTVIHDLLDYSATDKHKTILMQGTFYPNAWSMRWANTSAVTSWSVSASVGTFAVGSTFALYGIAA